MGDLSEILKIKKQQLASIENTSSTTTNTSIELPAVIDDLIDNKMYRNKFKKLIREGYLRDLLELAKMAATKNTPSRWFAKVTSKAQWERTLKMLETVRSVLAAAAEVAERIKAVPDQMKAIYKACWRLKAEAVRHAITAQETGRNKFTYFCWLTSQLKS